MEARNAACNLLPYTRWTIDSADENTVNGNTAKGDTARGNTATGVVCHTSFGEYKYEVVYPVKIIVKSTRTIVDLTDQLGGWNMA